jgi:hypothetical protein
MLTIGAATLRDLPHGEYREESLVSRWLRKRWYTTAAVVLIAAYLFTVDPRDVRLYLSLTTFFVTNFWLTPLVERKNALRSDRELKY